MKFNGIRTGILSATFFAGILHVPEWVSGNFWNIKFWEIFPFTFKYGYFAFIYAVISTLMMEFFIRLVKKYA
jgi:hypothetical protein